jgi:hypothetical protein
VIFTFFQRRLETRMSRGYVRTAVALPRDHELPPPEVLPHGKGGGIA